MNDRFVEEENTCVHFKDLSFQRGYGIFDFFRLIGNEPLFLDDHLERFFFSAREMRLAVPFERTELKNIIFELIRKNNLPNSGIRLSLTGGQSEDDFNIGKPNFLVSQHLFTVPTEEKIQKGIKLFTHTHQRQLLQIKTIDYLMAVWLQPKRIENGADDILYCQNGVISECPRNNIFFVTAENKIVTPSENVLAGITRKKILELANRDFEVEERRVLTEEISSAKEAFITSTTKRVLPVAQIDNYTFQERKVSQHLLQLFQSAFGKSG